MKQTVTLTRSCTATIIPAGDEINLAEGATYSIAQSLGGSVTLRDASGMYRVGESELDALGEEIKQEVLQSKEKGGSIITANFCISEKKPLFVMPDHPLKKLSKGGLKLISEGANLALSGKQIQNTLFWQTNTGNQQRAFQQEAPTTKEKTQPQQLTGLNDLFKENKPQQLNTQKHKFQSQQYNFRIRKPETNNP